MWSGACSAERQDRPQLPADRGGLARDAPVGVADHLVPRGRERRVASAVVLERVRVVVAAAVELDDQPVRCEERVGLVPAVAGEHVRVGLRQRQARGAAQGDERVLELAAGHAWRRQAQRCSQGARAATPGQARGRRLHGPQVEVVESSGLVDHARQRVDALDLREVHDRPREARDRDGPDGRGVAHVEDPRPVDDDARGPGPSARDRHLQVRVGAQAPQCCGRAVAGERARAARADRGIAAAVGRERGVPDRVTPGYLRCSRPAAARFWTARALRPRSRSSPSTTTPCRPAASTAIAASSGGGRSERTSGSPKRPPPDGPAARVTRGARAATNRARPAGLLDD